MKVWGLTGGLGMGKTTISQLLEKLGCLVIDSDEIARRLTQFGEPVLGEIQAVFGTRVIAADGGLRRDELARVVFADAAARERLEHILHPRIRSVWLAQIEEWRNSGVSLAVVVIPLLFETHAEAYFNKILCAACLPASQQKRLVARGWTQMHSAQRLAAQWPIAEKIARSDFVVWTEGGIQSTARQLELIAARMH